MVAAEPAVQLRLLELQAADSGIARLEHRRATLPELAAIAEADARLAEVALVVLEAETEQADVAAEQRRLENEVDLVRTRAGRDEARLAAGGLPAKELSNLQHEVASLARRQGTLEDELLEVMERAEDVEGRLAAARADRDALAAGRSSLGESLDAATADLDRDRDLLLATRSLVAAGLPADLLAVYDKLRAQLGGVGAAALRQRRCEGCRIELSGAELTAARSAAPEAVLRCENCRRILVRTAESGL